MAQDTDRCPGQQSLPESCPVCDHHPISSDLCKPNKALRTTLKAFLRTEEKKREKDRPSTTPTVATPVDGAANQTGAQTTTVSAGQDSGGPEPSAAAPSGDGKTEEPSVDATPVEGPAENAGEVDGEPQAPHEVSAALIV